MASDIVQNSHDWLRSPRTNLLAWWIPQGAILVGLLVPIPVRTVIWMVALIWMGTGLHSQRKAVWADPLPLHGSILPRDDCADVGARFWRRGRRQLWLVGIGLRHPGRKQAHLVGDRVGLGKILIAAGALAHLLNGRFWHTEGELRPLGKPPNAAFDRQPHRS